MDYLAVIARFPTLRGYKSPYQRFDATDFNLWAKESGLGSGAVCAAEFVLHLYSDCYSFSLARALGVWDSQHRAAFYATLLEEWPNREVQR